MKIFPSFQSAIDAKIKRGRGFSTGFTYAIAFDDGRLKVGSTLQFSARMREYKSSPNKYREAVVVVSDRSRDYLVREKVLIAAIKPSCWSGEWTHWDAGILSALLSCFRNAFNTPSIAKFCHAVLMSDFTSPSRAFWPKWCMCPAKYEVDVRNKRDAADVITPELISDNAGRALEHVKHSYCVADVAEVSPFKFVFKNNDGVFMTEVKMPACTLGKLERLF